MAEPFRVAMTRDVIRPDGSLGFGGIGVGLMQIANGLSRQLWLSFAVVAISAICVAGTLITAGGLLQQMAPPAMRGRIMTLFQMASWGMQLPGALLAGLNGSLFGAANAIVLSGVLLLMGAVAIIALRPAIRHWQPTLVNWAASKASAPANQFAATLAKAPQGD